MANSVTALAITASNKSAAEKAGWGQVMDSLTVNDQLSLTWTEKRGPAVKKPTHQGFGTRVMERMIRDQHKGGLRLDWRTEGLACEIVLPISKL
jgi:two-component sensor histidine kinase